MLLAVFVHSLTSESGFYSSAESSICTHSSTKLSEERVFANVASGHSSGGSSGGHSSGASSGGPSSSSSTGGHSSIGSSSGHSSSASNSGHSSGRSSKVGHAAGNPSIDPVAVTGGRSVLVSSVRPSTVRSNEVHQFSTGYVPNKEWENWWRKHLRLFP